MPGGSAAEALRASPRFPMGRFGVCRFSIPPLTPIGRDKMKKEVVVFGLVSVASVAFVLMQSTGDKKPGDKASVAAVTPGDSDIIPVGKSYAKGPATAPVTIVEFSDFQCPFCTRVNPTLKQVQDTYGDKVRIVFKHNPLPFHQKAPLASEASLAAGEQGKFWEMHDKLSRTSRRSTAPISSSTRPSSASTWPSSRPRSTARSSRPRSTPISRSAPRSAPAARPTSSSTACSSPAPAPSRTSRPRSTSSSRPPRSSPRPAPSPTRSTPRS
jgi:hypothetical protein